MPKRKRNTSHIIAIFAVGAILLLSSWGCKSPENTDAPTDALLTVINSSGTAVDAYLDSVYKLTIENDANGTIEGIVLGKHQFEARAKDAELVILSVEFDMDQGGSYQWTIDGPATLNVTNSYGETLIILNGGNYLTDVTDKTSVTIGKVPFGSFLLEAVKESDTTLVASTTLVVDDVAVYSWEITK